MYPDSDLTKKIIGAAIEVHKELGPGLLESVYEECMYYELKQLGMYVKRQAIMPVSYKEIDLDCGYRVDLLIEDRIIVELKAVKTLEDIHMAQVITYLKLSGCKVGLLINFHVKNLKTVLSG